jgi:putative ABC transport system permease protein
VLQDFRLGLRQLTRRPSWSLSIVFVLALGIGANAAMFSGFEAWVLRPLDFPEPERLVQLEEVQPRLGRDGIAVSPHNYGDWRERQISFESIGALQRHRYNLADEGEPVRLDGARISASLFPLLGKTPIMGRAFTDEDDRPGRPAPVALVSERLWRERFEASASVVGRTIRLDGRVHEIVGVMEPGFRFPEWAEVWTPLGLDVQAGERGHRWISVYARLAPGATIESARSDLDAISSRLEAEYPQANRGYAAQVLPLRKAFVPDVVETAVTASVVSALFVLLVICANVASLMLAQASARSRETAVRAALGASRFRLTRQSLAEGILLAIPASVLGALFGFLGVRSRLSYVPGEPPYLFRMSFSPEAGVYTFLLSLLAGLACGLASVVRSSGVRLHEALKTGGRETSGGPLGKRTRGALVLAEIALSTSLAAAALLMVKSFLALQAVDPGFESKGVLTAELSVTGEGLHRPVARVTLAERVVTELGEIRGVEVASAVSRLPASQSNEIWEVAAEGSGLEASEAVRTTVQGIVGPYFEALGIRLISGRSFTDTEMREGGKVIVVSEGLARALWRTTDVVGRRLGGARASVPDGYLVVGVAGDVDIGRDMVESNLPSVQLYQPYGEAPPEALAVVVKAKEGRGDVARLSASLRDGVRRAAPGIPLSEVLTMDEAVFRVRWVSRFFSRQLVGYAVLAIWITVVGLYGLTADSTVRRTRELAIRFALGATERRLVALVLKEAVFLGVAGVTCGLLLALALGQLVSRMFVTVSARDPLTLGLVSVTLFAVAILAALLPAMRAIRMEPTTALRTE